MKKDVSSLKDFNKKYENNPKFYSIVHKIYTVLFVLFLVLFLASKSIAFLILAVLSFLILRKYKKEKNLILNPTPEVNPSSEIKAALSSRVETKQILNPMKEYSTYVAGVTKSPYKSNIKRWIGSEREFYDKDELWEGYSNKEILSYDLDEVWEFSDLYDIDVLQFIPEPTNPYDPNAIKVVHEEFGEFGYIPREETEKIKKILESESYTVRCTLRGGRCKIIDYDDYGKEKVKIESHPNYINLDFSYR